MTMDAREAATLLLYGAIQVPDEVVFDDAVVQFYCAEVELGLSEAGASAAEAKRYGKELGYDLAGLRINGWAGNGWRRAVAGATA